MEELCSTTLRQVRDYLHCSLTLNLRNCAVKTWMSANSNEGERIGWHAPAILTSHTPVVTLLIVNSDNLPATQFASVFVAAGVDSMSYTPQSASLPASGWPTLNSLIDAGTRLVTFLSTTASFDAVPYLVDGKLSTPRLFSACSLASSPRRI